MHTMGISKGMHTDLGRSRPPGEEFLSGLPERCSIWQSREGNAIDGNYSLVLRLYQLVPAGFF